MSPAVRRFLFRSVFVASLPVMLPAAVVIAAAYAVCDEVRTWPESIRYVWDRA